ncbi:hypothetical protein PHLCEN_2v6097 [Hermanssonia centrifuga]|uniref:Protein kinase domain-containing protein n=1 Tax=Hermanssonia centrifuga TaxID=98765 RepID=A0A2R6P0G0_9APHY|nr:hypothetical protein PHLCEN_2v6097 [Hermanssonia centrifuga]
MPTLRIHIAPTRDYHTTVHYTLSQTGPQDAAGSGDSSSQLEFSSCAELGSANSEVYRGILSKTDGSEQEVVCKIMKGDTMPLEAEADLYSTELKDLQGTDVPRFFGLFTGVIKAYRTRIACILLEYCGPTMGGYFDDYDMATRLVALTSRVVLTLNPMLTGLNRGKIIEAFVRIHNAGVQHNDIETYHVILDQSDSENLKVRIIDFDNAEKHTCTRKMEIRPYGFAPWRGDFMCWELYDLALDTDFWTPTWFSFMGFTVSVFETCDPKSLAEYVAPYFTLWPRDVLEKKAQELLQEFRDKYRDRAEFLDYPFDGFTDSDGSDSDGQSEGEESGEESGETASESDLEDGSNSEGTSSADEPGVTEPQDESAVTEVH